MSVNWITDKKKNVAHLKEGPGDKIIITEVSYTKED